MDPVYQHQMHSNPLPPQPSQPQPHPHNYPYKIESDLHPTLDSVMQGCTRQLYPNSIQQNFPYKIENNYEPLMVGGNNNPSAVQQFTTTLHIQNIHQTFPNSIQIQDEFPSFKTECEADIKKELDPIKKSSNQQKPKKQQSTTTTANKTSCKIQAKKKSPTSSSSSHRTERHMGVTCKSNNCKMVKTRRCNEITEDQRKIIFYNYWNMNLEDRKAFVAKYVDIITIKGRNTHDVSRKSFTLNYHLPINNKKYRVCQKMFLSTLGVKRLCNLEAIKKDLHEMIGSLEDLMSVKEQQKQQQTTSADGRNKILSSTRKSEFKKRMGATCQSINCKMVKTRRCHEISEEQRKKIFNIYWHHMNAESRKTFVTEYVDIITPKHQIAQPQGDVSRKSFTNFYHLPVNNEKYRVCQRMFLSTLGLKKLSILKSIKKDLHAMNKNFQEVTWFDENYSSSVAEKRNDDNNFQQLLTVVKEEIESDKDKLNQQTTKTTATAVAAADDGTNRNIFASIKTCSGKISKKIRIMGATCESNNCKMVKTRRCHEISEMQRKKIFNVYWHHMNAESRKTFVTQYVDIITPKHQIAQPQGDVSRKSFTNYYYLPVNNEKYRVCQRMFLSTLGVKKLPVIKSIKKSLHEMRNF